MVSFQCDACQDVVKKPKLDAHFHNRCHESFTCVDCSKTFRTPAEWKVHQLCISEAEKYQKGLYKGKKTKQNGSNDLRGGRPQKSRDDMTNKPNGMEPTSANKTVGEIKQPRESDVPIQGNAISIATQNAAPDVVQTNGDRKEKKKKRKTDVAHEKLSDDAPTNEEGKKEKKKRKLDANDNKVGVAKPTGPSEGQSAQVDADPSTTEQMRPEAETKKPKKEKKKKDTKDKVNAAKDVEANQTGAPREADSQPSVDHDKKKDEPPKEKQKKKKEGKNVSNKGSTGLDMDTTSNTIDVTVAKKKKKERKEKDKSQEEDKLKDEREDGHATTAEKEDIAPEGDKLHKKRKRSDNEGEASLDEGSKNEKRGKKKEKREKKNRKTKAVEQRADSS